MRKYNIVPCTNLLILLVHSLFSPFPTAECANILFFILFGGASHRIAMEPLAGALSAKGHNVTFLIQEKPTAQMNPKNNYFVPDKLVQFQESLRDTKKNVDMFQLRKEGIIKSSVFYVPLYTANACKHLYSDPTFLELLQTTRFDIVLFDGLFSGECAYGIAHLHKAKTILFLVSTIAPWVVDGIGIPDESASIPDMLLNFPQEMNFGQRVTNALVPIFWRFYKEWYHFPRLEKITREGLQPITTAEFPSFTELEKKIDLVFVNTHVAQEYPRSLPPNVVPIGGASWSENRKPLSKELEAFINKGKNGFVYVSFGSYIDFSMFPPEVQQTFLNVLSNFTDMQFIWKMRTTPDNLPENIHVKSWMPQQEILSHHKIQVFITHSGLGSTNEAIFTMVPLLCFPIFADQDFNAQLVESKGLGKKMEITDVTENDLKDALTELLTNNKKYKDNMKRVNKQFLDRPMKPVDTAVWWTEYVLRQDNMDFLKPLNINKPWWIRRQIDVWVFLSFVLLAILLLISFLIWKVLMILYKSLNGRGSCRNRMSKSVSTKKRN